MQNLASIARNIWMQCALYDIEIVASHLAGIDNRVPDLLSRWAGLPTQWSTLYNLIPEPWWYYVENNNIVLNQDI